MYERRNIMQRLILVLLLQVSSINGHGRMKEPPSRVSAWNYGFPQLPKEYNDNAYNCGGRWHQGAINGGKCGLCGDPWDVNPPRPSEDGGKYGTRTIVRTYSVGQTIDVEIQLTKNHKGYMEFKLCPVDDCITMYRLQLSDGSGDKVPVPDGKDDYKVKLQLPKGLTCKRCVLQWRYETNNSPGHKYQEEFRACADVAIKNNGGPNPPSGGGTNVLTTKAASHNNLDCNSAQHGFIRDPRDCSRFYKCVRTYGGGWKQYPFRCHSGLVFNAAIANCDWSYNVAGC